MLLTLTSIWCHSAICRITSTGSSGCTVFQLLEAGEEHSGFLSPNAFF